MIKMFPILVSVFCLQCLALETIPDDLRDSANGNKLLPPAAKLRFNGAIQFKLPLDLDSADGNAALAEHTKEHQSKVTSILYAAERLTCDAMPKVILAATGVSDLKCDAVLYVTHPAKRRIDFAVDGIQYTKMVFLVGPEANAKLIR
jgi:hypothetical protein